MIKAIAFDYAGVISPGPMSNWIKTNLDVNGKYFRYYKQGAHKWDLGEMKLEQIYKVLSKITQIPQELIWDRFYGRAGLHSEVVEIIKDLKKNYKIILFSNFFAEILRKLLDKHGIKDLFDEIIISSEHKMKKHNPEFFDLLVKKTGIDKNEILFIDDTKQHVDAANELGIKSILFKNTKQLKTDLKNLGITV